MTTIGTSSDRGRSQAARMCSAWKRLAWTAGLGSLLCYFGAAFIPLPGPATMILAFAFGPLLAFSFLGLYRHFACERDTPLLQVACLAGVIAGVLVTTMLVVQVGNNMVREDTLADVGSEAAGEAARTAWRSVNRTQYLLDVVWDIFICVATILLGAFLWAQRGFGRIWGIAGMVSGLGLLVLNLWTFPYAPGETGLVDLGPLVALWMGAVFVRLIFIEEP
jgi:hypothetical protein